MCCWETHNGARAHGSGSGASQGPWWSDLAGVCAQALEGQREALSARCVGRRAARPERPPVVALRLCYNLANQPLGDSGPCARLRLTKSRMVRSEPPVPHHAALRDLRLCVLRART